MKRKNEFEVEFEKNSKKKLQTMVTKYSLKDDIESDGSDSEDDWVLATFKCKICKYGHKSLIQHLKKKPSCGQEYSESEWMDLRNGVNMIKKSKEYNRKKRNYKNNREVVLQRNRESYARNKDNYKPTRATYYKANAENMKKGYLESKKNINSKKNWDGKLVEGNFAWMNCLLNMKIGQERRTQKNRIFFCIQEFSSLSN